MQYRRNSCPMGMMGGVDVGDEVHDPSESSGLIVAKGQMEVFQGDVPDEFVCEFIDGHDVLIVREEIDVDVTSSVPRDHDRPSRPHGYDDESLPEMIEFVHVRIVSVFVVFVVKQKAVRIHKRIEDRIHREERR